jgi:predicted ATPase/class 3 adenylate cyclase
METESPDIGGTPPSLPVHSSVLTFLIADVRGYTAFTVQHGDEAAARLAGRFAASATESAAARGGRVIELRGDEALAVFPSARQALHAALDLQHRCAQEVEADPSLPLRVGIGLDSGEAVPMQGGYRGGALNLAARLCSIAGPGEVFASEGVIHLARKTEGIAFVDRGEATFKGLSGPTRVIQIALEGELPATPAPLHSLVISQPTNLPDEPTPFIGREREIDQIAGLLRNPHVRMVTLTGPGGTGKTRLAVQVGSVLLADFRDGVFVVDLAPLADPAVVPSAIAEVLSLREDAGKELVTTLTEALKEKHLLLVLDNYEHLLDASSLVAHLLATCRKLHVLVTSRIPLHLSRENEYPVSPLSVPDPEHLPDPGSLLRYEAIALFVQRAGAVKPGFAIGEENARAVAEICRRLDGLPLAIELAAARIKLFPPQALLQRLSSRLTLLTGGAKDRSERQQTLRNTIDWSYNLLAVSEQYLFARLSVFAGGATFQAAEAVCNPEADLDLLVGMTSLVDKSLLRQHGEEEPRFFMLETLREYAQQKLEEGSERETMREAHAHYFLRLAEEAESELTAADQHLWIERLVIEYDNLRAALGWYAATPSSADGGLRLAGALPVFWFVRGLYRDGLRWLDRMLALQVDEESPARVGAVWGAGLLWTMVGNEERARPLLEQSLTLAERISHNGWIARSLNLLGLLAFFRNNHALARELFERSVEMARHAQDDWCLADALGTLGSIYPLQGEFARAEMAGREALTIARRRGDRQGMRMALFGLALTAVRRGDLSAARIWGEEGLGICREIGDLWFTSYLLWILATVATISGDHTIAQVQADESLRVARQVEGPLLIVCALEASAAAARAEGNDETAASWLIEAEGIGRSEMVPHSFLAAILRAQGELAADRGDLEQARGRLEESVSLSRQIGDVWSYARSLAGLAHVAEQQEERGRATSLVREALAMQLQIEDRLGLARSLECLASIAKNEGQSERPARLLRVARELRQHLGAPLKTSPEDEGEQVAMSLEETIAYALGEDT